MFLLFFLPSFLPGNSSLFSVPVFFIFFHNDAPLFHLPKKLLTFSCAITATIRRLPLPTRPLPLPLTLQHRHFHASYLPTLHPRLQHHNIHAFFPSSFTLTRPTASTAASSSSPPSPLQLRCQKSKRADTLLSRGTQGGGVFVPGERHTSGL